MRPYIGVFLFDTRPDGRAKWIPYFAITASKQGYCSELPTKMKKLSFFINDF